MMQIKILLTSLLFLFTFAGDVFSQPADRPGMMRKANEVPVFRHLGGICFSEYEFMRFELELSDIQINNVSEINNEYGTKLNEQYKKLRPLNKELQILLLSKEIDLNKVLIKLQEISAVEIEIRMTKIRHRLAIEKIFNDRQMEKLSTEKKWILRHGDD